ncbi:19317_t:CDS:10, partial [Dentiscutata erythropus]
GPNDFTNDGSAVIARTIEVRSEKLAKSNQELEHIYEIERTVEMIISGGYEKIALQFPDELLADSAEVTRVLRDRTQKKIFVLADTSYGSCCVDEVAAQHASAECIIHYGRSCLSPTSRLPVLYVFGKHPIDIDHCLEAFDSLFGQDNTMNLIIMYDVVYSYCIDKFVHKVRTDLKYTNVIQSLVKTDCNISQGLKGKFEGRKITMPIVDFHYSFLNYWVDMNSPLLNGRYYKLFEGMNIESYTIFYIGGESATLVNVLLTYNKCKVYSYDPETRIGRQETLPKNQSLMRRFYMVQKAKDADVIGIVVGTLGVANYLEIISHLKKLIIRAGKKPYTFVMGKLNVAKMANFMEIDCFVLVSCPENCLLDSKEFYRPIVTPFELEIALNPSKQWTGEYITDFQQLLSADFQPESEDEPHFSLVTGKFKQSRRYALKDSSQDDATNNVTDLTLRNQHTSISTVLNSAAGEYLNSRTFRGLEQKIGETAVQAAEE